MSIDMNDALRRAQEAADVARAELRHALRAATHTQALMILPLIVEATEIDKKIAALVAAIESDATSWAKRAASDRMADSDAKS